VVLLGAALLVGITTLAMPTFAAEARCAGHSLNRDEIAHAEAVARGVLASSAHLAVTDACWNGDFALAELATQKATTSEGVQQWWVVSCQREASTWTCDPPEFKQFIAGDLPVTGQPHLVELSFERSIPLSRARSLASRALSIYSDPASRLRPCGTIEASTKEPVAIHRADKRASADGSFHVNVTRDGLMDSVWLDDVEVKISFDATTNPAQEHSPCWQNVVSIN
jgi:hypothetical protein